MKPEQLAAAKSIVQYAAVNGLESDEVILLGHAVQEVENLRAAILEYQQAPAAMEACADREIEYLHSRIKDLESQLASRHGSGAVEVPDHKECVRIANDAQLITGRSIWPDTVAAVLEVAHPIDPSRILKDGERAVSVEELEALRELLAHARVAAHEVEDNGKCDMSAICDSVQACDALRSGEAGEERDTTNKNEERNG